MNNDDGIAQRRTRLQTLQGRYEQSSHSAAPATPMTDPVASGQGRRQGKGGRVNRQRQAGPKARDEQQAGGLLQRLVQFLAETPPGDTLLPDLPFGEQRLQQAMRLLEQRARTAQGGAHERIQRLIKFLRQDIPGEPMAGGVNLWRLQQILERVGPSSDSAKAAPTPAPFSPAARMSQEQPVATDRANTPIASEEQRSNALEVESEIATLEADLQRLQAVAQDLQARLEQARQRAAASSSVKPSRTIKQPVNRPSESSVPPHSGDDNWFLEFLE